MEHFEVPKGGYVELKGRNIPQNKKYNGCVGTKNIIRALVFLLFFVFLKVLREYILNQQGYFPQQIHLSWASDDDSCVIITFNTKEKPTSAVGVLFGQDERSNWVNADSSIFVDHGNASRSQWIHRANICKLGYEEIYWYKVGQKDFLSKNFTFTTKLEPGGKRNSIKNRPYALAFFGDMGSLFPVSLKSIQNRVKKGLVDVAIHVGDFAYDMHSQNGKVGDHFMNMVQPIASSVAYLTCPGNHELAQNMNHYRERYSRGYSTTGESNMWWSLDVGLVHLVSLSTEVYFAYPELVKNQFLWLQEDLEKANSNRKLVPWIVVFGHRPPYCSAQNSDDCVSFYSKVRTGLLQKDGTRKYGLENLLHKQGVDLALWGHEHYYESFRPCYDDQPVGAKNVTSKADMFKQPQGVIHLISGSAGCKEFHNHFKSKHNVRQCSVTRSTHYGYGVLHILSANKLLWQQYKVSNLTRGETLLEEIEIAQSSHGPRSLEREH